uniref:Pentatricopeptide repeat-containing protein n=1 Tax=Kalanchoe fedtschenkoi TaxID=63787 RepID=A0A7N0UG59_KALFE
MASKRAITWTEKLTPSQVALLIRAEKDVEKARMIFDSATAEYGNGFRHDYSTFRVMMSRLLSVNRFRNAEELLGRMREEKCAVEEDLFLMICRAYGRVHKPLEAVRVFQKMGEYDCEASDKGYVTVLSILVDEGMVKLALRFYKYMRKMGVKQSVTTLNVLIKALCKSGESLDSAVSIFCEMGKHGCVPDSYTYGTLINGMCRLGKLDEAKALFKDMSVKGCEASVVTYTCILHGMCISGNLDEALGLFEEMVGKGIEPNVFTYSSLMDGLCKGGRSSKAVELLHDMAGKRLRPNMVTYSSLIYGLCKEKKLQDAVEIFDRMKLQGLKPDAGLYQKIITMFYDSKKFQEAANFLDEMILSGISPNRLTWSLHVRVHNMVVRGLGIGGDIDRAFQLYLSMRTRGISIESPTFDFFVSYFCHKGDLHKAARIMEEMIIDGCVPEEKIWELIVGGFWDRKKVREAAEATILGIQYLLLKDIIEAGM